MYVCMKEDGDDPDPAAANYIYWGVRKLPMCIIHIGNFLTPQYCVHVMCFTGLTHGSNIPVHNESYRWQVVWSCA